MSKNKGIFLWDVDGTLISTQRPLKMNLHQKVLEECGYGKIDASFETQGVTDWEIIYRFLLSAQHSVNQNEIAEILARLDILSEEVDNETIFLAMPGVINFLKHLNSNIWNLGILTGNTKKRTLAKLEQVSMTNYFNSDYIFSCEVSEKRIDIAKRARNYANSKNLETIVIIGDTPLDISVAREIGARVISVATGKYSKNHLRSHKPDLLIENVEVSSHEILQFLSRAEIS